MKLTAILFAFLVATGLSRAEWVIQQQGIGAGVTNLVIITINADKVREEVWGEKVGHVISINDMNTLDQIILYPDTQTFKRTPGSKIKDFIARSKAQAGMTNAIDKALSIPVDANVIEKIGDYECEVYKWSDSRRHMTNTLWVAKDYPGFEKIRPYLVRVDEFQSKGLDSGMQPAVGGLPGMVVKSELVVRGQKEVTTLLSTKEEPDKRSLFDVPIGYKEAKRP